MAMVESELNPLNQVLNLLAAARLASQEVPKPFCSLLGQPVCQQAFQRLLGLGSRRSRKLFNAHANNEPAPADGRFLKQNKLFRKQKGSAGKREIVVEFLEEIYHTISEPMPESKGSKEEADNPLPPRLRFRKIKGRRPKLAAIQKRMTNRPDMRLLPPGSFSDYLALLNARLPADGKVTLKMFSAVA